MNFDENHPVNQHRLEPVAYYVKADRSGVTYLAFTKQGDKNYGLHTLRMDGGGSISYGSKPGPFKEGDIIANDERVLRVFYPGDQIIINC